MNVPVGSDHVLALAGILHCCLCCLCGWLGGGWHVPRHPFVGDQVEVSLDHVILSKGDGESGVEYIVGTLNDGSFCC